MDKSPAVNTAVLPTTTITDVMVKQAASNIIKEQFLKAGIKDEDPYITLKEGLSAVTIITDKLGNLIDEKADSGTRHKYMVTALELMGHLKNKLDLNTPVEVKRQMSPEELQTLAGFVEELRILNDTLQTNKIQRGEVIETTLAEVR